MKSGATTPGVPFLLTDATTGETGQTGKSGSCTIEVRYGSTVAASSGTVTELSSGSMPGDYVYTPTSTETGTVGILYLHITCSGCQTVDTCAQIVGFDPTSATNLGLSALPTASAGASGGLPTGDASGRVLLQPTQSGVTIPTVTNVTSQPSWYTTAPTVSQIAAGILSNPSNLLATDSSGSPTLSSAALTAIQNIVWSKIADDIVGSTATLNMQDVMCLEQASLIGKGANSFNSSTHINTSTYDRADGATTAYSVPTQYTSSQSALPATSIAPTANTPLH